VSLKKLPPPDAVDVSIDLPVSGYIPSDYVGDMRAKIDLYRRLGRAIRETHLTDFRAELIDRFGPIPEPVENMLTLQQIRIDAHRRHLLGIRVETEYLVFKSASQRSLQILQKETNGRMRLVDANTGYLPLEEIGRPERLVAKLQSLLAQKS